MSHKRSKVERPLGVQLGLIITPMLDMSFQILAFFIMTYHPSALEAHIPGSLTPPENPATKSKDPSVPADPPDSVPEELLMPELDSAITVQVKAVLKDQEEAMKRKVGSPGQIFVRSAIETAPELLEGSDVVEFPKALEMLEARLKQMGGGKGSKANLKIAADGGLRYKYVLQVYDTAKRAGFERVHFVPPTIKSKLKQ
jgi:biopolymer transport protein ExbD